MSSLLMPLYIYTNDNKGAERLSCLVPKRV